MNDPDRVLIYRDPGLGEPLQRPAFTSYCVYFMLITNLILGGSNFLTGNFLSAIIYILTVVGVLFILSWKRFGFWFLVGAFAVAFLMSLSGSSLRNGTFWDGPYQMITLLILWTSLHMQRNGKTTWEYMR